MLNKTVDSFLNFDPTNGQVKHAMTLPVRYKAAVRAGGHVLVLDAYVANKLGGFSLNQLPIDWHTAILNAIYNDAREKEADMIDFDTRR